MNIELNKKQIEAFKELEKAFKKCESAKITFYAVIGDLMALNGNYIKSVRTNDFASPEDPRLCDITYTGTYYVKYPSEFADDEGLHMAQLTERGIKKLAKENEGEY